MTGCMSFSIPKTCCIVGLLPGVSAVQRYPTRRHSTISLTELSPSRNRASNASTPRPSLTNFLALATVSSEPLSPVNNPINTMPKLYTSESVVAESTRL
ncbi:hypothetical protein HanXRQr2_Chr16g0758261 [Helianthus annuus]|uniref:Uncharacterized protein n=1 Tax=Helianthus annuus TaxID=4232 RepID=A0A9K3DSH0_HELAN|nr:hypothetical protein HanXRQr2_Chr16g0758261 [Helianthus annuus]